MAVLVVAIVALTAKDNNKSTKDAAQTSTASASGSASPSPSASKTSSPSKTSSSSGPSSSSDSSDSSDSSGGGSDGARLPLVVLNNTTTNGLATQAAENFREGGWKVTDIGNLTNDIVSSCAYYDPDVDGAKAAAKKLQNQFPGIKRVTEKFPELPSGPIVVVLTSDYSGG